MSKRSASRASRASCAAAYMRGPPDRGLLALETACIRQLTDYLLARGLCEQCATEVLLAALGVALIKVAQSSGVTIDDLANTIRAVGSESTHVPSGVLS